MTTKLTTLCDHCGAMTQGRLEDNNLPRGWGVLRINGERAAFPGGELPKYHLCPDCITSTIFIREK